MMDFNRILKEMKSDLLEIRVHAHRGEKLAVLIWSDAAGPTGRTCPLLSVSFQELRRRESCKVANSVSVQEMESQSKIKFEHRGAGID